MSDTYEARVLADSISPDGVRLVTMVCVYPRFIHAEMLRHRVFAHSVGSSRAIPPEDTTRLDGSVKKGLLTRVMERPFVPDFARRVKGMGFGESLNEHDAERATEAWLRARDEAVRQARILVELDVAKASVNRVLEPYMWVTDIITATEWSNFFALRQPSGDGRVPDQAFPAQPEFQIIARMMRDVMKASEPTPLEYGQWHTPLVDKGSSWDMIGARASAGRCARASFEKQDEIETVEQSLARQAMLADGGHWSPMEHVARPIHRDDVVSDYGRRWCLVPQPDVGVAGAATEEGRCWSDDILSRTWAGHLRGWVPLRKLYENEHDRSLMIADRPEVEAL